MGAAQIGQNTRMAIKQELRNELMAVMADQRRSRMMPLYFLLGGVGLAAVVALAVVYRPGTQGTAGAGTTPTRATAATPAPTPVASVAPISLVGILKIESDPKDAEVYLDGKLLDRTPTTLSQQPVPHTFKLELKKEGFETWTQDVALPDLEHAYQEIQAKLVPRKR